ncbi:MAG: energy transducer TonB [Acidobacteriota bacterium]
MIGKNKNILKAAGFAAAVLGLAALFGFGREAGDAGAKQYKVIQWEMRLRIFEGVKEGIAAAPAADTSSYLKYSFSANFKADENLAEEQAQVQRIFNLKEARLLTEGMFDWKMGNPRSVDYVFRLDGREYLLRVKGGNLNATPGSVATQSFGVEVLEKTGVAAAGQVSLLDTDITVSSLKSVTVLGFEDSRGKPYFIALRQTKMYADEALFKGSGLTVGERVPDIKPPRLIHSVDPVYPEAAKKAGVAGVVIVELTIGDDGKVARVAVLKSVPLLEQAVVDAVRQWAYEPLIVDGKRRPVVLTATIQFMLARDKDGNITGAQAVIAGGVAGGILEPTEGQTVGWIDPKTIGDDKGGVGGGVEGGVVGGVQGGVVGGILGRAPAGAQDKEKSSIQGDAVKAVGDVKPPSLIHSVEPEYPEEAAKAGVEGTVIIEARADEKGNVDAVRILRSVPALDDAAVAAVKKWKYEPMTINGKPVKVLFTVTVKFRLSQEGRDKLLEKFDRGAVKAEGGIQPPKLVHLVEPVYPPQARAAGISGIVILAVKTDAAGNVQDAMILKSIPQLNRAAIDCGKQWKYEPLGLDGKATPVVFTVTVRFQ